MDLGFQFEKNESAKYNVEEHSCTGDTVPKGINTLIRGGNGEKRNINLALITNPVAACYFIHKNVPTRPIT